MQLTTYPKIDDLEACEYEPIRHIPQIQSHGCILILDKDLNIIQCSSNVKEFFGHEVSYLLDNSLGTFLNHKDYFEIELWLQNPVDHDSFTIQLKDEFIAVPISTEWGYILEIEKKEQDWDLSRFQRRLLSIAGSLSDCNNRETLLQRSAEMVSDLLDYDRVMIYKFDSEWNGQVVAEKRKYEMDSWLGLRYPASDIPKMARDLYLKQRIRMLSNVNDKYSRLMPVVNPVTDGLTDLGNTFLRGSSPFHLEYLNNMGVAASLSCAIIDQGKLWGLIACHNHTPKFIDFQKRQSCLLLSELIGAQINIKSSTSVIKKIKKSSAVRSRLVNAMSDSYNIIEGLTAGEYTAMDLLPDSSFAILYDGKIKCLGEIQDESTVQKIVDAVEWHVGSGKTFVSECIYKDFPSLEIDSKKISGVLFSRISGKKNECLIWMRPERVRYLEWGGNPDKQVTRKKDGQRLSPRKSFEKYKQKVQCTSQPWEQHEVSSVRKLTADIRNLIVTKYSEIKRLNKQLMSLNEELESFSYSVSHDLRGPLRGIDGFAQILMEDYGAALDDYGKESLEVIIKSAGKMNDLMDDILGYSGLGKASKIDDYHDLKKVAEEVIKDNDLKRRYPSTEYSIEHGMPKIYGDKSMIYLLMTNLLTNAFKYSSKSENPKVEIGCDNDGENDIFYVKDNGIGFKKDYAKKIFGVFTRLVKDEFKGTGVGLAIAQRIVMRHDGQIWAESKLGEGAVFKFYLQKKK